MITFRFYLISVVSFFLALIVGIVMGTTVIDRAVVDGLQSRINKVAENADKRRHINDKYEQYINALNQLDIGNTAIDAAPIGVLIYFTQEVSGDSVDAVEAYFRSFNATIISKTPIVINKKSEIANLEFDPLGTAQQVKILLVSPKEELTENYISYLRTNTPNIVLASTVPSKEALEENVEYDSALKPLKDQEFLTVISSVNSLFGKNNIKQYLAERLVNPEFKAKYLIVP
jgi:hypothetical protein